MGRNLLPVLGQAVANDAGDPLLNAAILAWNAQHLPWTDGWYQFPIFYPARDALTFSEHLLGVSVLATPLYWVSGSALATYNLALLLTFPLSGLAMYALVRRLTGGAPAALLAGLAFAFAPYRIAQLGHLQTLTVFWAPLALLGLHAYLESGRARWLALFGAVWALQGAANGYFLVYFSVLVALWVLWFVVFRQRWSDLARIALVSLVACLPLIPILVRFLTAHRHYGFARQPDEIQFFSADIAAIACASAQSLWGWLDGACRAEGELFPGVTLVVMCAASAWVLGRRRPAGVTRAGVWQRIAAPVLVAAAALCVASSVAVALAGPWRFDAGLFSARGSSVGRPFLQGLVLLLAGLACVPGVRRSIRAGSVPAFYACAAVVMWAMSWGPAPMLYEEAALPAGPYAWLTALPGIEGLRVPARFWLLTVLCLSVFAGFGIAALLDRLNRRWAVPLVAVAAVGFVADGWTTIAAVDVPGYSIPQDMAGRVVLTLPIGADRDIDIASQLKAVTGGWSSVNGYSGYEPAWYAVLRETSETADPLAAGLVQALSEVDVLVDERASGLVEMVERQPGVQQLGVDGRWRHYRLPRRGGLPDASPAGTRLQVAKLTAPCSEQELPFALDGNLETRWNCGPQTIDRELTVELDGLHPAGAIVLALGRYSSDFPRRLEVETSADGREWQPAWNGNVLAETMAAGLSDPAAVRIVVPFESRPARFIRIRQTGRHATWYWSVAEVEVWPGTVRASASEDLPDRP